MLLRLRLNRRQYRSISIFLAGPGNFLRAPTNAHNWAIPDDTKRMKYRPEREIQFARIASLNEKTVPGAENYFELALDIVETAQIELHPSSRHAPGTSEVAISQEPLLGLLNAINYYHPHHTGKTSEGYYKCGKCDVRVEHPDEKCPNCGNEDYGQMTHVPMCPDCNLELTKMDDGLQCINCGGYFVVGK